MSSCQYLDLQDRDFIRVMLEKYGVQIDYSLRRLDMDSLRIVIHAISQEQLHGLLNEVVRTRGDLRYRVDPEYRCDERWEDLQSCLLLDGYKIEDNRRLVPIEPTIEGAAPLEDDLSD